MDYIVDTLTKAPSQVLVKSASTFGEEAAKIIGGYIDESAKNVSDDVCTAVRDGASELSSTLKGSLSGFMDKFKETGILFFILDGGSNIFFFKRCGSLYGMGYLY